MHARFFFHLSCLQTADFLFSRLRRGNFSHKTDNNVFPTRREKNILCKRILRREIKSSRYRHTGIVEPEKMRIDAGKKQFSFEEGKSKCFSSTSCWKSVDSLRRKRRTRIYFIRLSVSEIQFAAGSLFRRELHPSNSRKNNNCRKIFTVGQTAPPVKITT